MPVRNSAATPALVDVKGAVQFRLDGELVLFKLMTGNKVVCGAISGFDFIESFCGAAEVAHQWSSRRYSDSGFRFQSKVSAQTSSVVRTSKVSGPAVE